MIYGASGYTGSRTAQRAVELGHKPVLAGRAPDKVRAVAEPLGLAWQDVDLADTAGLEKALADVDVVLNCAGPFFRTSEQLVQACLATGTHYLDVTGEIDVFERCAQLDAEATAAGVMLMPGVGFDLVPGDCLAVYLKNQLPDATWLEVGFSYAGPMTRGSAKTSLLLFSQGALVRRDHRLVPAPDKLTKTFDFGSGPVSCPAITFGDLAVSYRSTDIPNVTSFTTFNKVVDALIAGSTKVSGLIARPSVAATGEWLLDRLPPGPNAKQLAKYGATIVAEVRNDAGDVRRARMRTPNVYAITFDLATMISVAVSEDGRVEPGYRTPAAVFGPDFPLALPGCSREDLPASTKKSIR
ncbi:saccharopine dehydrogenase family protein [Micromonospora sp. WMMD736]|uniref:saccharopine dehydrogenase family protein n=1 Tax=Micromonospora sp. WMMD736 TaxID=3404112 RepID=UPI003B926387